MVVESPEERQVRRRRRLTFDAVPDLYEASRRGYPNELIDQIMRTARLSSGHAVVEIGCGTGQLTRQLVPLGVQVTAVDISPGMVAAARALVGSERVQFEACAFEDFDPAGVVFDLVISATAFHWIDPELAFVKSASVLRPDGWLVLLATGELYDEPFRSALRRLWTSLTSTSPAETVSIRPSDADAAVASGLFGPPVTHEHQRRLTLSPEAVAGVERTRATVLDYSPDLRKEYDRGLDALLSDTREIHLTQQTSLLMTQRLNPTS